ncbi:pro-glucagon-like [Lagopus leucura]|uniref:pro-glucagon-like n=1 Tax=Lagopus leucura TaxID=30410 RepID=UPI001C67B716|nr:pro-glucagon-like [Lagopus leucura]
MKFICWLYLSGLVLAVLIPAAWQVVPRDTGDALRWPSYEAPSNTKRHSEGTFTSDFTRYLDKMKAKDFVHWLINTKRYSSTKRYMREQPRSVPFLAMLPAA